MYSQLTKLRFILLAFLIIFIVGCGTQKAANQNDISFQFKYKMPGNTELKYQTSNEFVQTMEIRDQEIEIKANSYHDFTVKPQGMAGDNFNLLVEINDMKISMKIPSGEVNPDTKPAIGKSFNMTLSQLGDEVDLTGAEAIEYDSGPQGKRNIKADFQGLFPDFPGKPLAIGDSWVTNDTVVDKLESGTINFFFESKHTLIGFEKLDGRECIRVEADVNGIINSKTKTQGVDLVSSGNVTGKSIWFFDYKNGVLCKDTFTGKGKTLTTGKAAKDIKIPATRTFKIETKLL